MNRTPNDIWQPQPKQYKLLTMVGLDQALVGGPVYPAMTDVIGYGGAAGGGKSEALMAIALIALSEVKGVKIGYFRRTFAELEGSDGAIERSHILFPKIGAYYNKSSHVWRVGAEEYGDDWNEGEAGALRFCHCQYESDVHKYQSAAFDIVLFDEATHFTWTQIKFLRTRNRMSRHSELPMPFSVFASNPGGVGHLWFKKVFGIQDNIDQDRLSKAGEHEYLR